MIRRFFNRWVEKRAAKYDQSLAPEPRLMSVASGPLEALKLSAVIRALMVLGELGTVPLKVYRRDAAGQSEAPEHELYSLLHDAPNPRMTACEWRREMVHHMFLYGRHYSQIVMNGKAEIRELWPLHPSRVRLVDPGAARLTFRYSKHDGSTRDFDESEILHVPYLIEGKSIFEHASHVLGLGLSADQFSARYFTGGGPLTSYLSSAQVVQGDKKKEIVSQLAEAIQKGRTPFFDAGTELKDSRQDPSKVQLLEARRMAIEDVGRITGLPQHLLGALERSTNNNIEYQGIDAVTHGFRPLAVAVEQRMNLHLFGRREGARFFAEHNLDGLQRGDYASRSEGTSKLVAGAIITPNEGRKLFNMGPLPGGDRLYIQGAMVPIELAGQNKGAGNAAA